MGHNENLLRSKIPCEETGITIRRTLCDICAPEHHCGVDAYVKDGRVIKVEGTAEHPCNHGRLCTKGQANRDYIYRADRIQTPLRRVGERGEGKFEPITWDEAYAEIAQKLNGYKAEFGPNCVAFHGGYNKSYQPMFTRLAHDFGTVNYGSADSVCNTATVIAWVASAGCVGQPDLDHADVFLGWAYGGYYSSHLSVEKVRALKERGGTVIIVDPRTTPAVEHLADLHLQLRPGTDGALALGLANAIIENGWANQDFISRYTSGYEEYRAYVRQFTPARTEELTGVPEALILEAARIYATGGRACIQESASPVTHHINGVQNYRAILCLHALTGNFDRAGGNLPLNLSYNFQDAGFATREAEFMSYGNDKPEGTRIGEGKFPLWDLIYGEFQAVDLPRQILEETPYPIKAMIATGYNTRSLPDTDAIYKALKKLDYFVNIDLFLTDACKYADLVLPACSSFERGEFKAYHNGYVSYTKPAIEPLYDARPDIQIVSELARALGVDDALLCSGYEACIKYIIQDIGVTVEELKAAELPLRAPAYRPYEPGSFLKAGFHTPSGKFEFKSNLVAMFAQSHGLEPLPVYHSPFGDDAAVGADPEAYPFTLTSGTRIPNALHSRLHKAPWLRSLRPHPTADISRSDAERLGVDEGDSIAIVTPMGRVVVRANPSAKVLSGVVYFYHGYGEANINAIISNAHLDPYSGFPGYKTVRCTIEKVQEVSQ